VALPARRKEWKKTAGGSKLIEFVKDNLAAPGAGPAVAAEDRDLLEAVLARLSAEERLVLELRSEGFSWDEIGAVVGKSGNAVRHAWNRTRTRVSAEVGLGRTEPE
jgi:DNA-directed RNA polymerase specialized sigma24 family protein